MEFFSSISSLKTDDHLENFYIIRFYKRFDFYHVLNNKRANKAYWDYRYFIWKKISQVLFRSQRRVVIETEMPWFFTTNINRNKIIKI